MLVIILLIFAAYVIGSVPTGYLLGKLRGVDVRTIGSGNVGATNVARAVGKSQGIITLIADAAKGYLPVFTALQLGQDSLTVALTVIAVFLGHLYPLFLNFRGGKGVATGFGALLALAPIATMVLVVVFGLTAVATRIVSLGSLATAVAAPLSLWLFHQPPVIVAMGCFLGAMVIIRHRANIRRLLAGTEPRFGAD
jgi:acyl phosphate:glycerol-3-phosphate acyltransferase